MKRLAALVAAVSATAVVASCGQSGSTAPGSSGPVSVSVDFSRTDGGGPGVRFSDGQPVTLSTANDFASAPFVSDGSLIFTPLRRSGVSAYASTPRLSDTVKTITARWRFGSAPGGSMALSVTDGVNEAGAPSRPFAVRFVVSQQSWYLGVWGLDDQQVSIVGTGQFAPELAGGVDLSARLWIVDNWVTVQLPGGGFATANDTRTSAWAGHRVTAELFTQTGDPDSVPRLREFGAGSVRELPPAGGA
ncbi:hypothetical protein [Gordonia sp. N1V]|uniref:hypothetical protein n=1 Tax=Gordonia sp. N1V TaxID=3034163 RepID=UPI0023E0FB7B|nr:hypothetical protein [Gordonia sp. N1V]MDF3284088.1 hypothetical protein [Gordonia sp. N1V]